MIDAAIALFSEYGCEGTTMRDISERSGIKQPLIVYHFENKENLWKASVDEVWHRMETTLVAQSAIRGLDFAAGAEVESPEDLRTVLRAFLQSAAEHPEYLRILLREGSHRGPRFEWLIEHHTRRNYQAGIALLRGFQERGLLPEIPLRHLLYLVAGGLTLFLALAADVEALTGGDPRSEAFLDDHIDALMKLLATPGAER